MLSKLSKLTIALTSKGCNLAASNGDALDISTSLSKGFKCLTVSFLSFFLSDSGHFRESNTISYSFFGVVVIP